MFQKMLTDIAINLVKDKAAVIATSAVKEGVELFNQIHEDGISNTAKNSFESAKKYVKSITDKNVTVEKDKVYTIRDGYQFLMVDDADLNFTTIYGTDIVVIQWSDINVSFDLLPDVLPKGYTLMTIGVDKILLVEENLVVNNNVVPFPIKKL